VVSHTKCRGSLEPRASFKACDLLPETGEVCRIVAYDSSLNVTMVVERKPVTGVPDAGELTGRAAGSALDGSILSVVARRQPRTLLEWNVLFALGSMMSDEQRAAGKKLPVMQQARLGIKAMPRASRVGEFVAMWTIAKNQIGEVNVDKLAEFWGEPVRTMYRRLEEFREVWGPAGLDTPDKLADGLIADYRRRKEKLTARHIAKLLSAEVPAPPGPLPAGISL
jgi:hypothetical protein